MHKADTMYNMHVDLKYNLWYALQIFLLQRIIRYTVIFLQQHYIPHLTAGKSPKELLFIRSLFIPAHHSHILI